MKGRDGRDPYSRGESMGTESEIDDGQSNNPTSHIHVIGDSRRGKSTLLKTLIRREIEHRHGVMVINPHSEGENTE